MTDTILVARFYNIWGDADYLTRLEDGNCPVWSSKGKAIRFANFSEADAAVELIATYRDHLCPDYGIQGVRTVVVGQFNTELTTVGEQCVIPGCERNLSPKITQMELF